LLTQLLVVAVAEEVAALAQEWAVCVLAVWAEAAAEHVWGVAQEWEEDLAVVQFVVVA
jgi:hypothetical protein